MKIRLIIGLIILSISGFSQVDEDLINFSQEFSEKKLIPIVPIVNNWSYPKKISFGLVGNYFSNWSSGSAGINNISINSAGDFSVNYKFGNIEFNNSLNLVYNARWRDQIDTSLTNFFKTRDIFKISSSVSYFTFFSDKWFFNSNLSLETQMTKGYPNEVKDVLHSSDFFAPAFFNLTFLGMEYKDKKNDNNFITILMTPVNGKYTLVMDDTLSKIGAFGVEKGEKILGQIGFLFSKDMKYEVFKNVFLSNKLTFFSNYIEKFGNIDINLNLQINMLINKHLSVNITVESIYDDDIPTIKTLDNGTTETVGSSLQLRQETALTITYEF